MNSFSPLEDDFKIIKDIINDINAKKILEFGPGESTLFFKKLGMIIHSYENNQKYLELNRKNNIDCFLYKDVDGLGIINHEEYDLCFVDGPKGISTLSRYNTLKFSIEKCKYTILHDAHRKGEMESLNKLQKLYDIKITHYKTKKGLCLIERIV